MDEMLRRGWEQLVGRIGGPMQFRLVMQPIVATILASRAGLRDAKAQRSAYLWAILFEPARRRTLIREGWKDVTRVFVLAYVIDCIYQAIEFRWVYPLQGLIVAFMLAVVPYVLIRGPVSRLARKRYGLPPEGKSAGRHSSREGGPGAKTAREPHEGIEPTHSAEARRGH